MSFNAAAAFGEAMVKLPYCTVENLFMTEKTCDANATGSHAKEVMQFTLQIYRVALILMIGYFLGQFFFWGSKTVSGAEDPLQLAREIQSKLNWRHLMTTVFTLSQAVVTYSAVMVLATKDPSN